jgi:hypothetical protein
MEQEIQRDQPIGKRQSGRQAVVLTTVENAVQVEPVGEFELKGIRRPLVAPPRPQLDAQGLLFAEIGRELAEFSLGRGAC